MITRHAPFPIPAYLRSATDAAGPERAAWLAALPERVADLTDRWGLRLEQPFEPGGSCAWVAPGIDANGREIVLKVAWEHPEAEHEAEGLQALAGDGAARVYAFEHAGAAGGGADRSVALLLERCRPGVMLRERPEPEQHRPITQLLRRVWSRALPDDHPFRPLSDMVDQWADRAEQSAAAHPDRLDPGLVHDGLALFRELPRTATTSVLLCTDLHAGNVLSGQRRPWLLIDPKPYVGDPHYDVIQHLLNCERGITTDPVGLVSRVADLAGLDADRVRQWLFARCVQESMGDVPPWRAYDLILRRLGAVA